MKLTGAEIIQRVNKNDHKFFYDIHCGRTPESYESLEDKVKTVYDQNYGDGNDILICLHFEDLNLYIQLSGTYSSYEDPYWDSVSFAIPFEFTETRYKNTTLDYIRDEKINLILNEDKSEN